MTTAEARAIFNQIADEQRKAGKLDAAADTELIREYLTNHDFKKALEDFIWEQVS
jgi:hypothetical protein